MEKFFRKIFNNKGFTLVELIIVIAVLSIITAVVSPFFLEYVEKTRIGSDRNAVGEVGHAAEVVFVKKNKKDAVSFSIRINSKGKANYGGDGGSDFVDSVAEIIAPDIYTYKSKTYRGHTVNISVDKFGVAHIDENIAENPTLADKLGVTTDWGKELLDTIVDELGDLLDIEDFGEKLEELIFDVETDKGAFDSLSRDEKVEELNKKGEELGIDNLGTQLKPVLKSCSCLTCPTYCDCAGCPDKTTGGENQGGGNQGGGNQGGGSQGGGNQGGGSGGCVATGSLVTLSDGSVKKVEDLLTTDKILAFDHETGEYVEADILVVANHGDKFRHVMNLEFSNGSAVKLVDYHGLFDVTLNKYVYLTPDNFMEYKGHEFAMQSEAGYEVATLENAFLSYEYTGAYAVVTDYHMNCFTNGFFSIIPEAKIAVDAFEYDSDLKYDTEKMLQDIETYGLFEYEEFASYVSEEVFNLMPFKYVKVTLGKGLTTMDEVGQILEDMSGYLSVFGEEATYIQDMK